LIHGYGEKCGVESMVVEIVAIAAGLKAAVSAVKFLDSQLRNLRIMLNSKYGPATWDNIVKERDRIINRRKAQIKEQRETKNKEKEASRKKWKKIFKEIGKIAVLVAVVYSMWLWLMWAYHK
jgi:hypothetical protein